MGSYISWIDWLIVVIPVAFVMYKTMKYLLFLCTLVAFSVVAIGQGFNFNSELVEDCADYRVFHVTYDSPEAPSWEEAKLIKAFYYEPKALPQQGASAVLCLHVLGGGGQITKSIASFFAAHGLPALMPQMPLFLERRPAGSLEKALVGPCGPDYIAEALRAIPGDITKSLDFLASRPGVKADSIHIIGTSLGSILAVSAFAKDPRLDKAVLLLSGGNLAEILALPNPEVKPILQAINNATQEQSQELNRLLAAIEPLNFTSRLAAKAKNGKIRLYNAANDKIIPQKNSAALADALGLTGENGHFIMPEVDHYTAIAALPRILNDTLAFFGDSESLGDKKPADSMLVKELFGNFQRMLEAPTDNRTPSRIAFTLNVSKDNREILAAEFGLAVAKGKFRLTLSNCRGLENVNGFSIGQNNDTPWVVSPNGSLFQGNAPQTPGMLEVIPAQFHAYRNMALVFATSIAATGDLSILRKLAKLEYAFNGQNNRTFVTNADGKNIVIQLEEERHVPMFIKVNDGTLDITLNFTQWIDNADGVPEKDGEFSPPANASNVKSVDSALLVSSLKQTFDYVSRRFLPRAEQEDAICRIDKETWFEKGLRIDRKGEFPILVFAGSPEEIGRQHGTLGKKEIQKTCDCLKLVAGGHLFTKNEWFYDIIAEIQRRTAAETPSRFVQELDALSIAAGITIPKGREIGFFPELFHCSGIAARGAATVNGEVVHARVLDYMRDIGLQNSAQVHVFIPDGFNAWISIGFAGFNGTVTAMNAKGLAIGEIGGRGEGNWDGLPMSYLLRRIMEECDTVEEARKMIEETPLTCEYYYVISDKSGNMLAVESRAGETPTFLGPGESNPLLLKAFQDVCWITAPARQQALCGRLDEYYGRIDAETMRKIILRPVAMASNLHDAVFLPKSLDVYFSCADDLHPACDCQYHRVNLNEIIQYYNDRRH